jgi:predicted aspartyl protease
MGIIRVEVEVASRDSGPDFNPAGLLIVDTGAEVTWIKGEILRGAGIDVRKPAQRFYMANGEPIERDVGYAIIRSQGFETIDEVVFAHDGDLQLLGARTLEGFHAKVDLDQKRLVAGGPIIAAAAA